MSTSDQEEPLQPNQQASEQIEPAQQHSRADDAEAEVGRLQQRVAELEQQLAAGGQPLATEPTAADASSLAQQQRQEVVQPIQPSPTLITAPSAGDAASLVQQEPAPPIAPPVELTAAQEEGLGAAPEPAEDPATVIAQGGHLDASGAGCYCDRGGGHAPITEEQRTGIRPQTLAPAPSSAEQPLSADERAELDQLRAERAAQSGT